MARRSITSGSTFEAEIGYSRAVVDGDWVFVSGTTGFDYRTMTIAEGLAEQTEQCLRNIQAALAEAGATLADVVRVTYVLPKGEEFPECWPVLRRHFGAIRPAAMMISAGLADPRMRIEIEVTARIGSGDRTGAGPSAPHAAAGARADAAPAEGRSTEPTPGAGTPPPGAADGIDYRADATLSAAQLADLFRRSGIRRPIDDLPRLEAMIRHADLLMTAWRSGHLVGVARSLTDWRYCCYLSDLAVDRQWQRSGIGTELLRRTKAAVGEESMLLLLSAPEAMAFYPRIGMQTVANGWIIPRAG
jgi:enamine deaminase RidA (YjgF/YER057c/UK114 family)/GNAT superfamily N-acetyltransferase